jgi:protein translocase SEC61 complex gamma subunit
MVMGFIADSKRVLEISYKPDQKSFNRTLKIVLIGTLILGALGFVIATIITFLT